MTTNTKTVAFVNRFTVAAPAEEESWRSTSR